MCQYCGCDSNSVIGRLMDEHVDLVNLGGNLRRAVESGDVDAIKAAGMALAVPLAAHARMEEAGIFAQLRTREDFVPTVEQLEDEHDAIDELVLEVAGGDVARYQEFENLMRDHFDKEENAVFPAAYVELLGDDWDAVAAHEHDLQHELGLDHHH